MFIMPVSQSPVERVLNLLLKLLQLRRIKRLIPANVDQDLDPPIEF